MSEPTYGETMRARREALGYTQEQLAPLVGVTGSGLHRWETGGRRPRRPAVAAWERALAKLERRAKAGAA
jgi:transcriptional regulator with XRE-family HTH domain